MNTTLAFRFLFARNKKLTNILLVVMLISVLILSACGQPAPAVTQTPASTFTSAPPTVTSTSAPSPTPTLNLPVSLGTPYPSPSNKISIDNAKQIVELARYGNERGNVSGAMFLPDGKSIAVTTSLGIYLFDVETLEQTSFVPSKDYIVEATYSPNGETLAVIVTPPAHGSAELRKASDGSLIRALDTGEDALVGSIAFSPDGTLLAIGSQNNKAQNEIKIWQTSDGSLAQTLSGHKDVITNLIFSPDGQTLYSGSKTSQVISYQIADKKIIREYKAYTPDASNGLWFMSLSSDGSLLATMGGKNKNNLIAVYQTSDGKKIWETSFPFNNANRIQRFSMSPDGKYVAVAFADDTIQMWEIGSDKLPASLEKLTTKGFSKGSLAFSPDGKKLMFDGGNVLGIWDVSTGALLRNVELGTGAIFSASISPDGKSLAAREENYIKMGVHVWNLADGSSKYAYNDIKELWSVLYSPDGKFLVTGSKNTISFWPLSGGASTKFSDNMGALPLYPTQLALSPDGKFVAVRSYYGGGIGIYSAADGKAVPFVGSPGPGNVRVNLEFSKDGKYLIADLGSLNLIKTEDWKTVQSLQTTFATFSPDSSLLAYGQDDKTIQVSTVPDLEHVFTIPAQPETTGRLAYSPDGTILVSASIDGSLHFWNAKDGALLYEFRAHTTQITYMAFLPDGSALLTISNDGTIRLWGVKP